MKKIISLFMVLTMVLSLAACSTNQSPSESTPEESSSQTNESTPTPSNTNGKNLVVYFSMPDNVDDSTVVIDGETLGNTQYMAYVIQETVGADIFRIEPETPYPTDHDELVDLASEGKEYETLNLTDYRIGSYGQNFEDDELDQVIAKMKQAEVIVIGSPLYWHNICGSVRNILDRFYGLVENGSLSGRTLYFLFQGAAPEKWMLEAGEYTMKRFAGLYGMKYAGMATNYSEAAKLSKKL